jgi:hypothetical protein
MWSTLLFSLACSAPPDPDARLRAGDLPGAAAAWEAKNGAPLDVAHPVAVVLSLRAPRDPSITTATIAETVAVTRFLESMPAVRSKPLDLVFDHMADLGAALDALAMPPALVVVGRSENASDTDPFTSPRALLPWKGGRIVTWASVAAGAAPGAFEALGALIDANPPVNLVTIAMRDATGHLHLTMELRAGAWFAAGASDAYVGARVVLAADSVRDFGGAALRVKQGAGFVRR